MLNRLTDVTDSTPLEVRGYVITKGSQGSDYELYGYRRLCDRVNKERPEIGMPENHEPVRRATVRSTPESRYALNCLLKAAKENTDRMVEAASSAEVMDLAMAGMDLKITLRELWRKRDICGDDWRMVLNFLQTALAEEIPESLSAQKCLAVQAVVHNHLRIAAGQEDVEKTIDLLSNSGLDPWKAFAGFRE